MHSINLGLIFIAGLNVGLALLILLQNPKHKINITFALSVFFLALWIFGMAMFRESETESSAWFWTFLQNGSGGLIVIPFYLFSIYFPYQKNEITNIHLVVIISSLILLSIVVLYPGLWVKKIILEPSANDYINNRLGIGYFNIHFYGFLLASFYNLFLKYETSEGFIKSRILNVIVFTGITAFFGGLFSVAIPMIFLSLGPYWVAPYFSLPLIVYLSWFIFSVDN